MHYNSSEIPLPWYRQFWPWFIILFPALAVVGCAITIWIALNNQDPVVDEDYYQKGLEINQQLTRERVSQADLSLSETEISLDLTLATHVGLPTQLTLILVNPTDSNDGNVYLLNKVAESRYKAKITQPLSGQYQLLVESEQQKWRLEGEAMLPTTSIIELSDRSAR